MPYGTYCLRQRSVIKYHVRFYLSIVILIFLHLFSYYSVLVPHAEIRAIVIGSCNKTIHLIFVKVHITSIALVIIVVRIVYTIFAPPASFSYYIPCLPCEYLKTFPQSARSRTCLKNHSRNLHAPLCGRFCLNSVTVARYGALIQTKSPTNCDTHLAESLFQTRSREFPWSRKSGTPCQLPVK